MSSDEILIEMDGKTAKASAPWANVELEVGDHVGMMKFFKLQLESYVETCVPGHLGRIYKDIEGYDILIEKNVQSICKRFLSLKREAIKEGRRYPNNIAIINHMKESGQWK
jgi:hypothetical protein